MYSEVYDLATSYWTLSFNCLRLGSFDKDRSDYRDLVPSLEWLSFPSMLTGPLTVEGLSTEDDRCAAWLYIPTGWKLLSMFFILLSLLSVAAMLKTWFLLVDYYDYSFALLSITFVVAILDNLCYNGTYMCSLVRLRLRYSFISALILTLMIFISNKLIKNS